MLIQKKKFTALIGVNDVFVINTDDATLVCHRDYAQDVKLIVDYLKMNEKMNYFNWKVFWWLKKCCCRICNWNSKRDFYSKGWI